MVYKWTCRLCGGHAYKKHGGDPEYAWKVFRRPDGSEWKERIIYKTNTDWACKRCSVVFSNPRAFNRENNAGQTERTTPEIRGDSTQ